MLLSADFGWLGDGPHEKPLKLVLKMHLNFASHHDVPHSADFNGRNTKEKVMKVTISTTITKEVDLSQLCILNHPHATTVILQIGLCPFLEVTVGGLNPGMDCPVSS